MRVLLLCDGGGSLGVGHVIRSLALAEAAVAAGHDVVVAGHFEGSFVQGQLAAAPVEVVQLAAPADAGPDALLELIQRMGPDVLHVDSYHLSHWFMGTFVLSSMEDGPFGRRPADVVVDPTFGAELTPRPDDRARLLLRGSRFAPIRQRVLDARRSAKVVGTVVDPPDSQARSVLVVMGGTDPVGLAPAAIDLLARTGLALDVTVIAVGENAERVRAAARGSALSVNILAPVDDLASLMSAQDLVVSAAGTSVWELCCIGVPMALIWAVDNQRDGYDRVVAAGAALGLGGPELGQPERHGRERAADLLTTALTDAGVRAGLARAGRSVVDGLGAWRVVRTWEQALRVSPAAHPGSIPLTARLAGMDDARLLWQWRNDPVTRAGSRSSAEVTWDEHVGWLTASLARIDRVLLVVEHALVPVGTVRWDLEGKGEWEVSITVAPQRRGQSLARPLLRAGEVALSEVESSRGTAVTAYLAVVHVDNEASVRLFESSAYVPDLPPDPRGFSRYRKVAPVA